MALDDKVEEYLNWARKYAEKGTAAAMECNIRNAELYAKKADCDISAQVADLREMGNVNQVIVLLEQADKMAESGKAVAAASYLSVASIYAKKADMAISLLLQDAKYISLKSYENAVPVELEKARKLGKKGRITAMQTTILTAQRYASMVCQTIPEEVINEITMSGYDHAIPLELEEARAYAASGKAVRMYVSIAFALKYARRFGAGIYTIVRAEIDEIEQIGLKNAIPIELDTARTMVKEGNITCAEFHLSNARGYARSTKQPLDGVNEVRQLIQTSMFHPA